ncbi:extracellular solute-binding protein [Candidatus Daviesbacteria bacterium]|nr:extracellular solute-binding protein [Candidatus Daviesbacteria bacterium]
MKKIIIGVLALAIVLGFLFWQYGPFSGTKTGPSGPVNLTLSGLWEDEATIRPVVDAYTKAHPGVTINYGRQSSLNYRTRLQTQIQAGQGPDIYMIHQSWVPMFGSYLSPAPEGVMSLNEFVGTFYPVAKDTLVKNNQILAMPIEIDGLALYYNEDILKAAGVTPPNNWQDLITDATKMTVKNTQGQIQTAGAALGTAGNVDHWSDILGLLFLQQPQADLYNPATSAGADVLKFYTSFVTDPAKKTWDVTLPSSTQMFEQGRLAFYFAPSWRAHELRIANPNLKFRVVPVPQLPGRTVGWASFWAFGVSSQSKNQKAAWDFIKYLTTAQSEQAMYQLAAKTRLFGEPYSRVDLGPQLSADPLTGAFVNQGSYYKSWFLNSNTFDQGINDEMIKYFEDAINSVLAGGSPTQALQTTAKGVTQVVDKYTKPQPTASQK